MHMLIFKTKWKIGIGFYENENERKNFELCENEIEF